MAQETDAHLAETVRLAKKIQELMGTRASTVQYVKLHVDEAECITRLAQHILALDQHLRAGGNLPLAWVNDGTVGPYADIDD